MAAVTLTTLRARSRERADMPVAGFVPDSATGIDAWINEGVQKLQERLIRAYGEDFLEKSAAITTISGTTDYALPADFLVLYGVELNVGGKTFSLLKYNHAERNLYKNSAKTSWRQLPRYRLSGMQAGVVRLLPAPDGAYSGAIWYAPVATLLVEAAETVNFPNGWERYIVAYTAIQMLMKEESSVTDLRGEFKAMETELAEIAQRRDADQPHSAVDIEAVRDDNPLAYF